jgi:hypothetical protein
MTKIFGLCTGQNWWLERPQELWIDKIASDEVNEASDGREWLDFEVELASGMI